MPFRTRGTPPEHVKMSGELRVMQRLNEYEFGVELWVMRSGLNENLWDFRNMREHYLTFVGQPILCAYVGRKVGDGHNVREVQDPYTGEKGYTFMDGTAERIVGTLSDDPRDFSIVEEGGNEWIRAKGRLFQFYAPELVEKIVRTGRMDVSAETDTKKSHMDGDIEVITDWAGLGVTVLGDDVPPAIPGARIKALSAMQEEFKTLKLRAASLDPGKGSNETNKRKGVNIMSKKAMEAMSEKFKGYRVVALSEDGMHVGLVDSAGSAYTYAFNAEDNGAVVESRIKPAYLTAAFPFGEGAEATVEVSDIVDYACAAKGQQAEDVKALQARLDAAEEKILIMETAEHARRVEAVKEAVNGALADIQTCAVEGDADMTETAKGLCDRAEEFAAMETDGKFCGADRAVLDLMAAHGKAQTEKRKKEMAAKQHSFAWNNPKTNGGEGGGIAEMLSHMNG